MSENAYNRSRSSSSYQGTRSASFVRFGSRKRSRRLGILSMRVEGSELVIRVMEGRGVESKTYLPKGLPGRDYCGARFRGSDELLHVCDGPVAAHPVCYCLVHEVSALERETKEFWGRKPGS
jgi:hypothetical protein